MSLRTMRQYATLPALPPRGPMPPMVGVVIPIARTNLVTNPSIELATTGYTAVGGSIARSATQQYHGTYSLAVTPGAGTTDGAFYGSVALTSAQAYAFSCKFKGIAGIPYKISIATTGGADLSVYTFTATGRWQWVSGYYLETSSTNRRFYFTKNGSTNVGVFYVDGVQIEAINAGELASTYIDGDQVGLLVGQQPPAYLWTGTPHASTSTRSALTRAGGYVVNLSLYNFLLTGIVGLGMAVPNNISVPYTVLDGARYLRTQKPPRTLTLTGRWQSDDPREQFAMASDMRAVLDRDFVPLQQPLVLMVEPQDECGQVIGDFAQIPCIYAGGLEGNDGNTPVEDVAPTFTMYVPYLVGGGGGAALTPTSSVANANYIIQRNASNVWSAMSTGANAQVRAIIRGLDGTIYAGGDFTSIGASGADFGAKWDGSAWADLSGVTALNAAVYDWAVGPDGKIYAGGDFTNVDGIAAADYIAVYDPVADTWAALGTGGASAGVRALVFDRSGNLYAGGNFTQMGGIANTANLAKWNGSAWSSVGVVNGQVLSLAADGNNIYAGGDFTTAGGVTVNRVAKYNGSAWSSMAGGTASQVTAVAVAPNRLIYASGTFTTIGGVAANSIAQWNGTSWSPLGLGLNNYVSSNGMAFDGKGQLWVVGAFATAGGMNLANDPIAFWTGSSWMFPGIDTPGIGVINAILLPPDGNAYLGYTLSGTATSEAQTIVNNATPSYVWPTLKITGPTNVTNPLYTLVNYTTGAVLCFNDLQLQIGENVTINFDPQNFSAVSTFRGDISSYVVPGSTPSLFYLAPGNNTIALYFPTTTGTAALTWDNHYNGIADLVN